VKNVELVFRAPWRWRVVACRDFVDGGELVGHDEVVGVQSVPAGEVLGSGLQFVGRS
jgi:hypothetical protein